jgi:hypothetical protein
VETTSRGNDGSITFRDWHPAGAGESGYIAPDPSDPNITYGGSTFGELFRYDKRTGQDQIIAPEAVRTFGGDPTKAEYRFTWTSPVVFSPQDSNTLYFGSQYLLRTRDRGNSWERISPDLTGTDTAAPREGASTVENAMQRGHGVIYSIAPSRLQNGLIWVGTDTGRISLTRDSGKTWKDVTPAGLAAWSKISMIEASHFDQASAYAAVDRHRLADIGPHIFRTHDSGRTWREIVSGIPSGAYTRTVREDPVRKGLLFAGTELGIYFSLDDGDHWQPLLLNMPVVPVHDLVIKDNDLVAATHGRSFWILDDISPLRQLSAETSLASAYLFKPAAATRIRASTNSDTPLTPEVPAGENPPPGAIFYYYLKSAAQSIVKLEVLDARGQVVRAYSSNDKSWSPPTPPAFPSYWFRPAEPLSTAAGMHRFVWDLRYSPPPVSSPGYSMATVFGRSVPVEPTGPQALPGQYQLRLTVDGKSQSQTFSLQMDPRVKSSQQDLEKQFALETRLARGLQRANQVTQDIHEARAMGRISAELETQLAGSGRRGQEAEGTSTNSHLTLSQLSGTLSQLIAAADSADAAPTTQVTAAAEKALHQLDELMQQWQALKK